MNILCMLQYDNLSTKIRQLMLFEHHIVINTVNTQYTLCDSCQLWFHGSCLLISDEEYEVLSNSENFCCCMGCKAADTNQLKWGKLKGEKTLLQVIKATYLEITKWKKNLFSVYLAMGESRSSVYQ